MIDLLFTIITQKLGDFFSWLILQIGVGFHYVAESWLALPLGIVLTAFVVMSLKGVEYWLFPIASPRADLFRWLFAVFGTDRIE